MVATPLHGEIAPFRVISPPMKFPPQAVIGGSSAPTVDKPNLAEKTQARRAETAGILSVFREPLGGFGGVSGVFRRVLAQKERLHIGVFVFEG